MNKYDKPVLSLIMCFTSDWTIVHTGKWQKTSQTKIGSVENFLTEKVVVVTNGVSIFYSESFEKHSSAKLEDWELNNFGDDDARQAVIITVNVKQDIIFNRGNISHKLDW